MIICLLGGGNLTIPTLNKAKVWVVSYNKNIFNCPNVPIKKKLYFTLIILYIQRKGTKFCPQKQEFTKVKKHEITGAAELSSKYDPQSILLFTKRWLFGRRSWATASGAQLRAGRQGAPQEARWNSNIICHNLPAPEALSTGSGRPFCLNWSN